MDTNALKKFAQSARRQLIAAVDTRLEQVLCTDSAELREMSAIVNKLQQAVKEHSRQQVVENAAYTWFNRFCALRFMDINHYTPVGIVSPVEGFTQPEILQEAKKGLVDAEFNKVDKQHVFGLLNGQISSANPQQEAYRWLLVGACNSYYERMPFLFPEINDYTALLMPSDLLSDESILAGIRETLIAETCKDVEVIGWLYQFYISEKKDQVMARKSAVPKEDIPAVTQLFTPHWIVRYLVENSLGRLWMLNHPDSRLVEHMEFFIKPDQQETDFIKIKMPEEIKICDPACGSGHMLTYAFDLLAAIYEEQGYDPVQISSLIIKNNLFGIEIDDRAGQLAAFALMMKARQIDKRFFTRGIKPNICVMEDITFSEGEIKTYMDKLGRDLFTQDLWFGLRQFEDAKTYGSLIRPQIHNPGEVLQRMQEKGAFEDLFLFETNRKVKKVLEMVEYLSPRYLVVIANPPYMGGGSLNHQLKNYASSNFSKSKSDTYSMFIERNLNFVCNYGFIGMITLHNWLFLSSFESFRKELLSNSFIDSMIHNGRGVWGSDFGSCSFVIVKKRSLNSEGRYKKLFIKQGEVNQNSELIKRFFNHVDFPIFKVTTNELIMIPGCPIAYWVSNKFREIFNNSIGLLIVMVPKKGIATGNNDRFLRYWYEVDISKFVFPQEVDKKKGKWYATTKGGDFRKWYGNHEFVLNWENNGFEIRNYRNIDGNLISRPQNLEYFFKGGITWSDITISQNAFRIFPVGFAFEGRGPAGFCKNQEHLPRVLAYLNSKVATYAIQSLNQTVSLNVGEIAKLPIRDSILTEKRIDLFINKCIGIAKDDWDSLETSWDFTFLPLINKSEESKEIQDTKKGVGIGLEDGGSLLTESGDRLLIDLALTKSPISLAYNATRLEWQHLKDETLILEQENNRIFIEAYGLKDELKPDVPPEEITLTCNPRYRYGGRKSDTELEALLLADTMKEFISYGVGCMFGRYSLDKPGLILANQGETLQDYLNQVPQPRFMPDRDNVLPILEDEWFADDIVSRFREFLKVTFGSKLFEENMAFLENAIGRDIRAYFLRDFYNEHVKMYKKRPIYWLFSSPKGSFNALIYMHRYQSDIVSIVLNEYLIPYREKLNSRKSHLQGVSQNGNAISTEKNKAIKEVNTINAVLLELKEYEDDVLYPLARERIVIDLDDGVKVNYAKFGKALKSIPGLDKET